MTIYQGNTPETYEWETLKKHMNSAPNLLFLQLPSIRAWLQYSNYNYYSIFFWGKGQQSPQSPFLHSSIPPFLHSSIPPFLRSSPPVMLEDFKELRLWDIQEVLCNNKVTVIESSKVGHQGGDRVHSAYSQDVSEKSHQLTRCSFSLQKMDSAPLHLSNCGSLTACNILSWPTGRQKNTPAFFMIQYTALKGR